MDKQITLKNPRKYIVKSNSLVEARYRLSLQESHVIYWLLTQIRADDEDFKPHQMSIVEFSKMIGVEVDNQYSKLRDVTQNLMRRILNIYEPEKNEWLQVAWLSSARYQGKKGIVILKFDPDLKPYLLKLQSHFTKIDLVDTMKLKSVHSIRMFELLLQYLIIGNRKITIEDLRLLCGIQQKEYIGYNMLKRKVIDRAKTEINAKTEYDIDYKEIKESRKVVAIDWTIKKKPPLEATAQKVRQLQKEYRSESVIIDSLVEYGFSRAMAKRFITNNGEDVVSDALKSVNIQVERGTVKNPRAMLQMAIKEKWKPDVYKNKKIS